mmetsp:Transcript_133932/g.317568  ORF Transcript_133932/g.317568 Transcript_133932/m.317568 type:complete len:248 (+) Transcript_133932:1140-1883(+)
MEIPKVLGGHSASKPTTSEELRILTECFKSSSFWKSRSGTSSWSMGMWNLADQAGQCSGPGPLECSAFAAQAQAAGGAESTGSEDRACRAASSARRSVRTRIPRARRASLSKALRAFGLACRFKPEKSITAESKATRGCLSQAKAHFRAVRSLPGRSAVVTFQCLRLDRTCGNVVPLTLQLVRQLITCSRLSLSGEAQASKSQARGLRFSRRRARARPPSRSPGSCHHSGLFLFSKATNNRSWAPYS